VNKKNEAGAVSRKAGKPRPCEKKQHHHKTGIMRWWNNSGPEGRAEKKKVGLHSSKSAKEKND